MLYKKFLQECKRYDILTDTEKAALIYELTANDTRAIPHYGIAKGHPHDQFWLYAQGTPSTVLLQASKNKDGNILLSIQGLRAVIPNTSNFLDFFDKEKQADFLKYLALF